jgi:hypothetical protein
MAKSCKVTVYIRVPGTRERVRATNKNTIATGTVFCLRYVRAGQRVWETLNVSSFAEAQKTAIDRNVALVVGRPVPIPDPRPEPVKPKPTVQTGAVPPPLVWAAVCALPAGKLCWQLESCRTRTGVPSALSE